MVDRSHHGADVGTLSAAGALGSVLRWLPLLPASARERLGDLVAFRTTPDATPEAFAAVAASQADVVDRVRERAPRARILLVDYLTLIGAAPVSPLTSAQVGAAAAVGRGLAQAFRDAAARSGAELVAASSASGSHGVGSAEPWVYGFEIGLPGRGGPVPYHPNLTGMTEVAALVVDAVRGPAAEHD